MDVTGLSALFQLPPEQAIAYLDAKGNKLTWSWWEMQREAHAQAFTVAKLARLDILQDIRAAVETALKEGRTERWFRQELEQTLKRKGWWGKQVDVDPTTMEAQLYNAGSPRRLQTIYRTNLQTAYMAGRQRQFDAEIEWAPYVQYIAVMDAKTRPGHAALNGKVFRLDDPAWDRVAPPNGYNCRCRARNLSERELKARGLKVQTDTRLVEREAPGKAPIDPRTGETVPEWRQRGVSIPDPASPGKRITFYPDTGWDYNPGRAGVADIAVTKLAGVPSAQAAPVVRDLVSELLPSWLAAPRGNFPLVVLPGADAAASQVGALSAEVTATQRERYPDVTPADYAQAQRVVEAPDRQLQSGDRTLYVRQVGGQVLVVETRRTPGGLWVTSYRRLSPADAARDAEIGPLLGGGR